MSALSGPMLAPFSGDVPRQAVVLLHGYGADGNDLIALGRHWQALMPEALFVSPDAPESVPGYPAGRQWFALSGERPVARLAGLPAVRPLVEAFLVSLWEQTGIKPADTLLVGFSQGAMVALHVGLSLNQRVMGIIAFSGALVPPENFPGARPPVALIHGALDTVVEPEMSVEAERLLQAADVPVRHFVSPDAGHGIPPDGLAFANAFITELLTPA